VSLTEEERVLAEAEEEVVVRVVDRVVSETALAFLVRYRAFAGGRS